MRAGERDGPSPTAAPPEGIWCDDGRALVERQWLARRRDTVTLTSLGSKTGARDGLEFSTECARRRREDETW